MRLDIVKWNKEANDTEMKHKHAQTLGSDNDGRADNPQPSLLEKS